MTNRTLEAWVVCCAIVSVHAGCVAEAASPAIPQVSDSLGIAVIHHTVGGIDALALSSTPELIVGNETGGELFRVRGGLLRPNGGIAVANGGSKEIYLYSATGDLEARVGREGQGPEEFANILWIQGTESDGFIVYDAGNQRVTRWGDNGGLRDSWAIPHTEQPDVPDRAIVGRGFGIGVTSRDEIIMIPWAVATLDGTEGPFPVTGVLRRLPRDSAASEFLDSVAVRWWYERDQDEGPPIEQIYRAPVFLSSANRRWTAYSEAKEHRVVVLNDGVVSYVVTEDRSRTAFRPDSVPTGMSHAADSLPSYRALQVDSDGRIWVQSGTEDEAGASEWRVISDGGRRIRSLVLPASTAVLDAHGDRVALLERDELDVETVVVRRITVR